MIGNVLETAVGDIKIVAPEHLKLAMIMDSKNVQRYKMFHEAYKKSIYMQKKD